jgi:hypothetical protein
MAGCGVQLRFARAAGVPKVEVNAHSTCGHTAAGDAWIYTTPLVASANWFDARISCSFGSTWDVFPNDPVIPFELPELRELPMLLMLLMF